MNYRKWLEQKVPEIDQDGRGVQRIRLQGAEGTPWESWERPFPAVPQLCEEVQTVLEQLKVELPARPCQLLLIAEDGKGTIISQCPISVLGQNKSASPALTAGQEARAHAEAMDQIVRTTERLLGVANTQIRLIQESLENSHVRERDYQDFIRAKLDNEALVKRETGESETTQLLTQGLKEGLPLLIEFIQSRVAAADLAKLTAGGAVKNGSNGAVKTVINAAASAAKE